MFPVLAPEHAGRILREIIPVYLADNVRARRLDPDGAFRLLAPGEGQPVRRCQSELLETRSAPVHDAVEASV
jgi:polyphosphate kinase